MLMVLMAFLKQIIPHGKMSQLMKAIVSVFILLSIVEGVMNFDFNAVADLVEYTYVENASIWDDTARMIGDGLRREFEQYLSAEKIDAKIISVAVEGDQQGFDIIGIKLSGTGANTARNLISARYQIDIGTIEVINE